MTFSKPLTLGLLASFLFLLASSELACRWAAQSGFWYRHFDFTGDLTSLPEVRDRLHSASRESRSLFLLGDSVLGPTALQEHRVPAAREKSLAFCLEKLAPSQGDFVLSLGADGMLLPDMEALALEIQSVPAPKRVVLILNFRMFAPQFDQGPEGLSRAFFKPDLPPETTALLKEPSAPSADPSLLNTRVDEAVVQHWFLFRTSQLLRTLWYFPSQKDVFQSRLENWFGEQEDPDLKEAALKLKISSFYGANRWNPDTLPFQALDRLLDELKRRGIPTLVVLTPQNLDFLRGTLDLPSFGKNREFLAAFMKKRLGPLLKYADWSDRYPTDFFLDHCHLTPDGNRRLAADLIQALPKDPS